MGKVNSVTSLDSESRAMLYEGANLSQLTILFRIDHRGLVEKLHGLEPKGERRGAALFDIAEAAARLWRPTEAEVDAAIRRMNHADLPKALTKEYWAGQKLKQEYQLTANELWSTTEVADKVGALLKVLKIQLQLTKDTVERTTELTPKQRRIIIDIMNGTLADMAKAIEENFGEHAERINGEGEEEDDEL